MRHFFKPTHTHQHPAIEGLNEADRKDHIKAEAHHHRELVNHSIRVLRTTQNISEKRTHLQILKERLSAIKKLTKQHDFLKVTTESFAKVEQVIFEVESSILKVSQSMSAHIPNPAELIKEIKIMKEQQMYPQLEKLLVHCITTSEEATIFGASPWYYEQLADIYREQQKHKKEVMVLEQYLKKSKAPNHNRANLYKRLDEARTLQGYTA